MKRKFYKTEKKTAAGGKKSEKVSNFEPKTISLFLP